jgi:hypothetical protein
MSAITEIGLLSIQAARMYLEVAEATREMTEEEAKARFAAVSKRVAEANELWEAAANWGDAE